MSYKNFKKNFLQSTHDGSTSNSTAGTYPLSLKNPPPAPASIRILTVRWTLTPFWVWSGIVLALPKLILNPSVRGNWRREDRERKGVLGLRLPLIMLILVPQPTRYTLKRPPPLCKFKLIKHRRKSIQHIFFLLTHKRCTFNIHRLYDRIIVIFCKIDRRVESTS